MDELGLAMPWADIPGHVSYVLIAISYWMTNVFWLRVIAVVGLVFEILYFRMSGGAMHTGIGWDIVFIAINLFQIYRLVADQRRLRYMKELHLLSQGAFADLTREQLAQLVKAGSWRTLEQGTQITREGEPVTELVLICDGQVVVEAQGRTIAHLHGGSWLANWHLCQAIRRRRQSLSSARRALLFSTWKGCASLFELMTLLASAIDRVVGRDLAAKLTAGTKYSLSS